MRRNAPTIIDVAARAGVSKSLVSLVLRDAPHVSDDSRRRVKEAAAALGYRPNAMARGLVERRSRVIGVVLSDFTNPFFAEVAVSLQAAAAEHGLHAVFNTGDLDAHTEATALETLLQMRPDGIVLTGPVVSDTVVRRIARETPVVVATRAGRSRLFDSVWTDDDAGSDLAVGHLAELGHRRIVHITGGDGANARARTKGFIRAMERRGLTPRVTEGSYTEEGGFAGVADAFRGRHLPTAVFAANDFAAVGVMEALAQRGLHVPGDVSVVGFDDTWLADLAHLGLTTVSQPTKLIAETTVQLLRERIDDGRTDARRVVLEPAFTVRSTTAPPP